MKLTIIEKREISLPFSIESDKHGGSYVEERDGMFYLMNRLDGKIIQNKKINKTEARRLIKETLDDRRAY